MTRNECLYGYLETLRQCRLDFAVPQTVYSDNQTIFRSPKTRKLTVDKWIHGKEVHLTQFGRSMHESGVDLIFAKHHRQRGISSVYGQPCRAVYPSSWPKGALQLYLWQTAFWKMNTGICSIKNSVVNLGQNLSFSHWEKIQISTPSSA